MQKLPARGGAAPAAGLSRPARPSRARTSAEVGPPRSRTRRWYGRIGELIRGAEGGGEPLVLRVHAARVPAAALCRRPPRPRRAVMAVGDVGTGHAREGVDERRGVRSPPHGMADAVGGRQVVEGGRLHRGGDQAIDLRAAAIRNEHGLGVRLERQDVARAVVLLVRARALVLSDHVALVVGDGDAPDHPDLRPCAHHLAIHEERRIGIAHQHPVRGEASRFRLARSYTRGS